MRIPLIVFVGFWILAPLARPSESDALAISANIRANHMPFGTILDPIYATSTSRQVVGYTRCGDSALWTGAFLAAEAFRYKVTQSADALDNVRTALAGLKGLADVTGDNRLARCMFLASSPYAVGIESEEAHNTVHQAPPWVWIDNTSRDEIVGAFFGLGAAFDLVDDAAVKSGISELATRLVGFIAQHQWSPNDDISNTFRLRPEELQMLLQVARHVNPSNNINGPFFLPPLDAGVIVDTLDNSSYFKFNLDYMTFYNLIRLQNDHDNNQAYQIVRNYTAPHQNAFFDIVDHAIQGPNTARDAEMQNLLDQWLQRSRRDFGVDNSKIVPVCFSEACRPIPVQLRTPTDFLWQRNPFQLAGGGDGFIESAGIDYILPYWMARYYGVLLSGTVQSAAAPNGAVAPSSLATLFGTNLGSSLSLGVTDSNGTARNAMLLYVSSSQINFVVRDDTAPGPASFAVNGLTTPVATGEIQSVAPTLFSMSGDGHGVAAATAISVQVNNPTLQSPVPVFNCASSGCFAVPISLGVDTSIYVTFYGTGIRNRSSLANVVVKINGFSVYVLYVGPSPGTPGLDQVNVLLPLNLRGSNETNVILTVDGQTANVVTINIA